MKKETLIKANELNSVIEKLKSHIEAFILRIKKEEPNVFLDAHNCNSMTLLKDFLKIEEFSELYLLRANKELARLEKELEDLRD